MGLERTRFYSNWRFKYVYGLQLSLLALLNIISTNQSLGQFKSIDFEISTSPYFDDRTDDEYAFDNKSIFGISQFGVGYSAALNNKIILSPKVAFGLGTERYSTRRLSPIPNTLPDSIYFEKKKTAKFFKLGVGTSYWFKHSGEGFFVESEIQGIFSLSGKSEERKQIGFGAPVQEETIDYKDELKSMVPSLRVGAGYNLTINRVILFVRASLEFRASTYFTTTDNYTWANRSLGFGFRYVLK